MKDYWVLSESSKVVKKKNREDHYIQYKLYYFEKVFLLIPIPLTIGDFPIVSIFLENFGNKFYFNNTYII